MLDAIKWYVRGVIMIWLIEDRDEAVLMADLSSITYTLLSPDQIDN